jgi:hypothetical protein
MTIMSLTLNNNYWLRVVDIHHWNRNADGRIRRSRVDVDLRF